MEVCRIMPLWFLWSFFLPSPSPTPLQKDIGNSIANLPLRTEAAEFSFTTQGGKWNSLTSAHQNKERGSVSEGFSHCWESTGPHSIVSLPWLWPIVTSVACLPQLFLLWLKTETNSIWLVALWSDRGWGLPTWKTCWKSWYPLGFEKCGLNPCAGITLCRKGGQNVNKKKSEITTLPAKHTQDQWWG